MNLKILVKPNPLYYFPGRQGQIFDESLIYNL